MGIIQGMVFFEKNVVHYEKKMFDMYKHLWTKIIWQLKFFHCYQFDLKRKVTANFQEFKLEITLISVIEWDKYMLRTISIEERLGSNFLKTKHQLHSNLAFRNLQCMLKYSIHAALHKQKFLLKTFASCKWKKKLEIL